MQPNLKAVLDAAYEAYKSTRPDNILTKAVSSSFSFVKSLVWEEDGSHSKLADLEMLHKKVYTGDANEQFNSVSNDITHVLAANKFINQGNNFKNIVTILIKTASLVYQSNKEHETTTLAIQETLAKLPNSAQQHLSIAVNEFIKQLEAMKQSAAAENKSSAEDKKQPTKPQTIQLSKEQIAQRAKKKAELAKAMFSPVKEDPVSKPTSSSPSTSGSVHSFHQKKTANGKTPTNGHLQNKNLASSPGLRK